MTAAQAPAPGRMAERPRPEPVAAEQGIAARGRVPASLTAAVSEATLPTAMKRPVAAGSDTIQAHEPAR